MSEIVGTDNRAEAIKKRFEDNKAERGNWESHWDEVAKYVIPRKDNVYGQATPGEKRANRLFDSEAIRANDDLGSAFHGLLTNPSNIWFGLKVADKEINAQDEVQKWLHSSVQKMIDTLNGSNFQVEIKETYDDLGSTGTTCLLMEEDDEEVIRFASETVYGIQIEENEKKEVDTILREYELTLRQLKAKFGEEVINDEMVRKIGDSPTKKHKIIQEIAPRNAAEMRAGEGDKGFAYSSIHIMKDVAKVVREGGMREKPFAVPRWTKTNSEKFGRSPAMKVLADIKMINLMKKVTIQGGQLRIAPPFQIPDNGFLAPPNLTPLGANYYRSGTKDRIEPLFQAGDPGFGLDFIEAIKVAIKEGYHVDKLKTVVADRMTATEVLQRRDEQLRFLGPILGRLDRELLKPVIDRLFAVMLRKELFDDIPDALKSEKGEVKLQIKYLSSIAKAQTAAQSEDITRALGQVSVLGQIQPEIFDNIDGDKFLRKTWEIANADPELLKDPKEVKAIREQRAQAQQEALQQEQAMKQAETVSKLEKKNVTGETP